MSSTFPELDIDAIRSRLAKAGQFSLPRWVATDTMKLLAEVERLRAGLPPVAYETEMKKKDSRIWVLERDLVNLKAAHATEVARLEAIATEERQAAAAMEYEAEAERLSIAEYLRNFADDTPPGPVSPVRKAAQDFARRTATFIEVGNHRRAAVKEAS